MSDEIKVLKNIKKKYLARIDRVEREKTLIVDDETMQSWRMKVKSIDEVLLTLEQKEKLSKDCLVCNTHNWAWKCITCEMKEIEKARKQGAVEELEKVKLVLWVKSAKLRKDSQKDCCKLIYKELIDEAESYDWVCNLIENRLKELRGEEK